MSGLDDELRNYLDSLTDRLSRDVSAFVEDEAEALRTAIVANVPKGAPSALSDSVQVRRSESGDGLEVTAGGDATTRLAGRGSGTDYDYALSYEYGTQRKAAEPFFHTTVDDWADGYARRAEQAIAEALSKHE